MRIMNRLVATEGRDKGGKLVLITSRLNAESGGRRKRRTKGGKTKRAGNLDSASSCDDGLVPVRLFVRHDVFRRLCVYEDITTKTSRFPRA